MRKFEQAGLLKKEQENRKVPDKNTAYATHLNHEVKVVIVTLKLYTDRKTTEIVTCQNRSRLEKRNIQIVSSIKFWKRITSA